MKILQVLTTIDPAAGGVSEAVLQLSVALMQRGHQIEVATFDDAHAPYLKDFPVPVVPLGRGYANYRLNFGGMRWIAENSHRFDAVVGHGLWQFHIWALVRGLRKYRGRVFVYPHGMMDRWFRETYPVKHSKKLLHWILFERKLMQRAHSTLFTCQEELSRSIGVFPFFSGKGNVVSCGTVVPEDADGNSAEIFFSRFPETRGKRIFLFLGRIHEKKGCDLLISQFLEVAGDHKDLHLVMAGPSSGGLREMLEVQIKKVNLQGCVTWTGMLDGDLKWGAFRAAEVFVLPSHQENFGVAVAEALGCGLPVLISNKVNIWGEIENGQAGYVFNDDEAGVRDGLERWLSLSELSRKAMEENAKKCFDLNFHRDFSAKKFESIAMSSQ